MVAKKSTPKKNLTRKKPANAPVTPAVPETQSADSANFPIVGIGASAGGLEAFEQFFRNTPPDSGMEAEASVRNVQALAENIFNTMREPLIVLDAALRVVSASRSGR